MNIAPTAALRKQAQHLIPAPKRLPTGRSGLLAIAFILATSQAGPLVAQQDTNATDQSAPTPGPSPAPAPAPSQGSGYSLPPGTSTAPRPDAAQGPSDESSPPRTISPDRPAATPIPAPVTAPVASIPAPESRPPADRTTPTNETTRRSAPLAETPTANRAESPVSNDASEPLSAGEPDSPLLETPAMPTPDADPGFDMRPPVAPGTESAEPEDNESWPMLFALAAALSLIIVASVILILRRRPRHADADLAVAAPMADDDPPPPLQTAPPEAAPPSAPLPDSPAPRSEAAPDRGADPAASESAQDAAPLSWSAGVTGVAASPRAPESASASAAPNAPPSRLAVDLAVTSGEMTLINTIVTYRLTLGNIGKEALSDLAIHGMIVQARRESPSQIPPARGADLLPLIERMPRLPVGISDTIEGELRLPLDRIEPIRNGNRILLVPLVYIWVGYDTPDGARFAVSRSFVIGEESNPPGDKVGPLRLDPGPRRFTTIGQRPLISG